MIRIAQILVAVGVALFLVGEMPSMGDTLRFIPDSSGWSGCSADWNPASC